MRGKGINYDTGFINKGVSSREPFDLAVVTRELHIIRDDLHCNAVRVTGGDPARLEIAGGIAEVPARANAFLSKAVAVVRARFGGRITYAAMPFEGVDWTPFDIISLDIYRSVEVADRFAAGIRALAAQGKPVAITEFGSTT